MTTGAPVTPEIVQTVLEEAILDQLVVLTTQLENKDLADSALEMVVNLQAMAQTLHTQTSEQLEQLYRVLAAHHERLRPYIESVAAVPRAN